MLLTGVVISENLSGLMEQHDVGLPQALKTISLTFCLAEAGHLSTSPHMNMQLQPQKRDWLSKSDLWSLLLFGYQHHLPLSKGLNSLALPENAQRPGNDVLVFA